jgi:hypothetical protein
MGCGATDEAFRSSTARKESTASFNFMMADRGPQSSSASRFTAGAFGFLTLTQRDELPEQ